MTASPELLNGKYADGEASDASNRIDSIERAHLVCRRNSSLESHYLNEPHIPWFPTTYPMLCEYSNFSTDERI